MKSGLGRQALLLETVPDGYRIEGLLLTWDLALVHKELRARNVPAADEVIGIFLISTLEHVVQRSPVVGVTCQKRFHWHRSA